MIQNKLAEISQLRELAMSVSSVKNEERVQTTPDKDRQRVSAKRIYGNYT